MIDSFLGDIQNNPYIFSLICICYFIAGTSKAISDTLAYHFDNSIFNRYFFAAQWWNPLFSWVNKYKNITPDGLNIYNKEARFFWSKWLFVIVTDAWHFFNFIRIVAYLISGVLIGFLGKTQVTDSTILLTVLVFANTFDKLGFTLNFNFFLVKNKKEILQNIYLKFISLITVNTKKI